MNAHTAAKPQSNRQKEWEKEWKTERGREWDERAGGKVTDAQSIITTTDFYHQTELSWKGLWAKYIRWTILNAFISVFNVRQFCCE